MSSFPQHCDNVRNLESMGFYVDDCFEDGEVTMDSWGYDELTYLLESVIDELKANDFNFKQEEK